MRIKSCEEDEDGEMWLWSKSSITSTYYNYQMTQVVELILNVFTFGLLIVWYCWILYQFVSCKPFWKTLSILTSLIFIFLKLVFFCLIFKYHTTDQGWVLNAKLYPFAYRDFGGSVGAMAGWITSWGMFLINLNFCKLVLCIF